MRVFQSGGLGGGDGDGSTVVFDHFLSGGRGMSVLVMVTVTTIVLVLLFSTIFSRAGGVCAFFKVGGSAVGTVTVRLLCLTIFSRAIASSRSLQRARSIYPRTL